MRQEDFPSEEGGERGRLSGDKKRKRMEPAAAAEVSSRSKPSSPRDMVMVVGPAVRRGRGGTARHPARVRRQRQQAHASRRVADAGFTDTKRQMKKLSCSLDHVRKEATISRKRYNCMLKANENLVKELRCLEAKYDNATQANGELKEQFLLLKENYESMTEKNARLEEQIAGISSSFQFLKGGLPLPEIECAEQHMLLLEPADHCAEEPAGAVVVQGCKQGHCRRGQQPREEDAVEV